MSSITKGAIFSSDKNSKNPEYRYQLWRIWDDKKPLVFFIGLNPSNADCKEDDKTIAKLMNFAKQWGYGGLYIGNLFAFVTPYPSELIKEKNPVGEDNDKHLKEMALKCEKTICIWGNDGVLQRRDEAVKALFSKLYCIEKSKDNNPKHPLYLKSDLEPIEF